MAFNWNKFPWTNLHDLNLDWIIQKVRELEIKVLDAAKVAVQYTDSKISDLLTGAGDLTINKSGDVRITATNVVLSGTTISSDGEQLHLHDTTSNTSLTASYRSNVLGLVNNQDLNEGVAIHDVKTPADGDGDNNKYAANCGYVKTSVNAVSSALATETANRTAGDNALQSTIDNVIMPLLNARGIRDFHVTGTAGPTGELTSVTFKEGYSKSEFDNLLSRSARVRLVVEIPDTDDPRYDATLFFDTCATGAGTYAFSSVYVIGATAAYPQIIVYNGTAFTIVNPDFLTLETLPIYGGEIV